jgi:hypothetical protein
MVQAVVADSLGSERGRAGQDQYIRNGAFTDLAVVMGAIPAVMAVMAEVLTHPAMALWL